MTAARAGFALNDATLKRVPAGLPLLPAVFVRGLCETAARIMLGRPTGAFRWRLTERDGGYAGPRAAAETGALLFLAALANMPIASAVTHLRITRCR